MRIIDAHVHVIDNYPSMTPFEASGRYDRLLFMMDRNGVEKALMIPVVAPITPDNNEECAKLARSYPDRLATFTDVALDQADAPAGIAQARHDYDAVGVSWYGDIGKIDEPAWEALAQHELTANLCVGPQSFGLLAEVARAHPQVVITLMHLGLPGGLDLADGTYGGLNAIASLDNVFVKASGFYAVTGWDTGNPLAGEVSRSLVAAVGADKIMWGSDWPCVGFIHTYQQSLEIVRSVEGVSEGDLELILGGVAARVYGI
jgi:L-fuconolactonase